MTTLAQRLQLIGQRTRRAAQSPRQAVDLPHAGGEPFDRVERERRMQLLTMPKAAAYLGYEGENAANSAYCFLRKHGAELLRRGTVVLVRVGTVDDVLARRRSRDQ